MLHYFVVCGVKSLIDHDGSYQIDILDHNSWPEYKYFKKNIATSAIAFTKSTLKFYMKN